jgi:DNA polymerase-3 subunit delta'
LIFSGAEGIGKRPAAQAVAQALNCLSPVSGDDRTTSEVAAGLGAGDPTPGGTTPWGVVRGSSLSERASGGLILDACGTCPACKRIARGMHSDVQTLVPGESGSIKIEHVREAVDRTMYRPFEGRRRVTIVEQADALVPPAQNALLKTLEEPPSGSMFILVTSRPDILLSTVRSRCSHMRFGRLGATEVAAVLERDHGYSRRDALAVAAHADGSVRRALNLITRAEDFADARSAAGQLLRDAAGKADARGRLERAKDLLKGGGSAAAEREYLSVRLEALGSILRDLGILATGADERLLANADLRPHLEGLAQAFGSERALRAFTAVDRAHEALDRNVSPKVVADWLALQV